jgi:hypothetical protein
LEENVIREMRTVTVGEIRGPIDGNQYLSHRGRQKVMIMSTRILSFAAAIAALAGTAQAALVENISNGGFGAGGSGWTSSNVVFTNNYLGLTSTSGGMAVIGGINPLSGGTLGQSLDLSGASGYANVSFDYRLAALDLNPFNGALDGGDRFTVKLGTYTLLDTTLNDPNSLWNIATLGPTITNWATVSQLVPISALSNPLTVLFRSTDLDNYQAFVALIDNVSIQTQSCTTPEPGTMLIWSVLGGVGMVAARRRRSIKAA